MRNIYALKPLFHELGYEIYITYRLIKIVKMPKCYFDDNCGDDEPALTHVWTDLFVVGHTCAIKSHNVALTREYANLGQSIIGHPNEYPIDAKLQPIRCRCGCFATDLMVKGTSSYKACTEENYENLPEEPIRAKEMMHGLCGPLERVMVGDEPILPYRPDRKRIPFGPGFIWGFENSEEVLRFKYGNDWWKWLGNAAKHGNNEICRFYQAELLFSTGLNLRSYAEQDIVI